MPHLTKGGSSGFAAAIWLLAGLLLLLGLAWVAEGVTKAADAREGSAAPEGFDRGIGVTTVALDPELAKTLGLPGSAKGLVVTSTASSRASEIQPGDVIQAVNGRPVASLAGADGAVAGAAGNVTLLLNRHGHLSRIQIEVAAPGDSANEGNGS
jgi:S1-C subfamily serine protease